MSKPRTGASYVSEFCLLTRFYFRREILGQPKRVLFRLLQYLFVGLIVSFVYFDPSNVRKHVIKEISVLSTTRLFATFASLPFLANYLAADRKMIAEGLGGIAMSAALVVPAKLSVYLLQRQSLMLVYTAIVYPLTGLRVGVHRAIIFLVILWCHQFAKSAVGFFVSACFVSKRLADFFLSTAALINLVFSGGMVSSKTVSPRIWWMRYTSISFYANQALLKNQFEGDSRPANEELATLLQFHGIEPSLTIWSSLLIILAIGIGFTLAAIVAMILSTRHLVHRHEQS